MQRTVEMGACLIVHRQYIGTRLFEVVYITAGVHNHQMHIQRLAGMFLNMFHHGLSKTDVRHKHTVHHIHMQPVAFARVEHLYVALQVAEVGTE